LEAPPRELIFSQTENYVEYTRHGKPIKGEEKPVVRSRYEEDVYVNNHTSVWGSYWDEGRWGYQCCHSFVKNSYCTGAAGKKAGEKNLTLPPKSNPEEKEADDQDGAVEGEEEAKKQAEKEDADRRKRAADMAKSEEKRKKKREKKKRKKEKKKKRKKAKKRRHSSGSSSSSSSDEEDDEPSKTKKSKHDEDDFEAKVRSAMEKQREEERRAEAVLAGDERARPYNSGIRGMKEDNKQMSEAEMEAYYRQRQREEDPMAKYLAK